MPFVNYCKKCKTEVPLGESCPHCGGKLSQNGEQLSFGMKRKVVREWFAWNNLLRIALPVFVLVFGMIVGAEAAAAGAEGVIALISQGFLETMLGLLALMLFGIFLLLHLQGVESVHTVIDRQGIHVRTYIADGNDLGRIARFVSLQSAERLTQTDDRAPLPGLMLVHRVTLPWMEIRRVRIWKEGSTILFFRPSFWQVAAVRCPVSELGQAEEMIRKKLKRSKKVRILPPETSEKKRKS